MQNIELPRSIVFIYWNTRGSRLHGGEGIVIAVVEDRDVRNVIDLDFT